jgi:uncharacterized protein YndB with AHSA1/START domain
MTRIVATVTIHCPIRTVFNYITTPANWPAWIVGGGRIPRREGRGGRALARMRRSVA